MPGNDSFRDSPRAGFGRESTAQGMRRILGGVQTGESCILFDHFGHHTGGETVSRRPPPFSAAVNADFHKKRFIGIDRVFTAPFQPSFDGRNRTQVVFRARNSDFLPPSLLIGFRVSDG